jgi:hypothetical protein
MHIPPRSHAESPSNLLSLLARRMASQHGMPFSLSSASSPSLLFLDGDTCPDAAQSTSGRLRRTVSANTADLPALELNPIINTQKAEGCVVAECDQQRPSAQAATGDLRGMPSGSWPSCTLPPASPLRTSSSGGAGQEMGQGGAGGGFSHTYLASSSQHETATTTSNEEASPTVSVVSVESSSDLDPKQRKLTPIRTRATPQMA